MSDILRKLLIEEEDRIPHAYLDHLGFWTIGVGHLIDKRKGGRLPDQIIDALLDYDIAEKTAIAARFRGWEQLSDVRKAVLVSMCFQMGSKPLSWPNFRRALEAGDFIAASQHGMDSVWARVQTPARARRQMRMLTSGEWEPKR